MWIDDIMTENLIKEVNIYHRCLDCWGIKNKGPISFMGLTAMHSHRCHQYSVLVLAKATSVILSYVKEYVFN